MKNIRHLVWGALASGAIFFGWTAEQNEAPGRGDLPSRSPSYIKIDVAANPTNDFRKAIATNDVRFVGYSGFAVVVPGVSDYYTASSSRMASRSSLGRATRSDRIPFQSTWRNATPPRTTDCS